MRRSERFGPCLRKFRLAAGMSQTELAKHVKTHKANICAIERGRKYVGMQLCIKLCDALQLEPWEIRELLRELSSDSRWTQKELEYYSMLGSAATMILSELKYEGEICQDIV